jgi:predicted ATPase
MLLDLRIQNYRSFRELQIKGLSPVNLIVGANNSGKTSLLEAVYLLVSQNDPQRLLELLSNRGEFSERYLSSRTSGDISPARRWGGVEYQVAHIFYGHQIAGEEGIRISTKKETPLSLQIQLQPINGNQRALFDESPNRETSASKLVFKYGSQKGIGVPVNTDGTISERAYSRPLAQEQPYRFITTNHLSFNELAGLWDGITLTPKEEKVVEALQILEPDVERISFTSRQTLNSGILLKLSKQKDPIPLGSMGDGMRRLLTLIASAVISENGVLLVDEIDTGLYFKAQTQMWSLLFEMARRFKIQVFCTTHSWDCVRAFDDASRLAKNPAIGTLFRLSRRGEKIEAVAYTANELAIAMRQDIEVR